MQDHDHEFDGVKGLKKDINDSIHEEEDDDDNKTFYLKPSGSLDNLNIENSKMMPANYNSVLNLNTMRSNVTATTFLNTFNKGRSVANTQ